MSYETDPKIREKIDKLLHQNAAYQAQQVCVTNSKTRKKEINRFCRVNFLTPIKDLDPAFYDSIKEAG